MGTLYEDWAREKGIDTRAPAPTEKPKKKGFSLASLLPTGGGIGGALAGAAGGAAIGSVVPVIGTGIGGLVGAILGGAGGSAAGKVGQNALEGEKDLSRGVAGEALLGGVTSTPITAGFKVAKGGLQLARGTTDAAKLSLAEAGQKSIPRMSTGLQEKAAADVAAKKGLVPDATGGLVDRVRSTGLDLKRGVAGTTKVADNFTQEKDLVDTLTRNGLKGSAANQYKNVDGAITKLSNEIDTKLSTVKKTADRNATLTTLKQRVIDSVPDDSTFTRELDRSLSRIAKSGDGVITAKELFTLKKDLGKRLGTSFKKIDRGGSLTAKEEVDMALWRNLDEEITKIAPEVKRMTLDQSKLMSVRPGLQKSSEKTMGVPLLGIKSQALERASQKTKDFTGDMMTSVPEVAAAPSRAGQGLLGAVMRESLVGTRPGITDEPTPEDPALDPSLDPASAGLEAPVDSSLLGDGKDQTAQVQEGLQKAALAALASGDSKGLENIIKVAGLLESMNATAKPKKKTEAQVAREEAYGISQDALSTLNEGGVATGPLAGALEDFKGIFNAGDQKSVDFNRKIGALRSAIVKARGGSAVTDTELKLIDEFVPKKGDSDQMIRSKLDYIARTFGKATADFEPSTVEELNAFGAL